MGKFSFVEPLESRQLLTVVLDQAFGTKGVVSLGIGGISARATTSDGKILVAGAMQFHLPTQSKPDITRPFVARLLANGRVDTSFGGEDNGQPTGTPNGIVVFTNRRVLSKIAAIAALADGGAVLAGASVGDNTEPALVKLNPDGTLDSSFGGPSNGYANSPAGSLFYAPDPMSDEGLFRHLAVSGIGRISVTGDLSAELVTFDSDGSLTSSFADHGVYSESPVDNIPNSFEALAYRSDGTLVVSRISAAGNSSDLSSRTLTAFDLTATGTSGPKDDATISSATFLQPGYKVAADEFATLSDDSLLLLTHATNEVSVYHLLPDLSVDGGFNNSKGFASVQIPGTTNLEHPSISVIGDNRFYVSAIDDSIPGAQYLARFLPDGSIDPVFGTGVVIASAPQADLITPAGDDVVVITQAAGDVIRLRKVVGGVSIGLSSRGTLLVGGTSANDAVSLTRAHGQITAHLGDLTKSFDDSAVKRISIYTYGGNDLVTVGDGIAGIFADGGAGKDTLTGGDGNDTLLGNTGNDQIFGGLGNDNLSGGGGNDYLFGDRGNDTLAGNGGHDTLSGAAGNDVLFGGPGAADTINGGTGTDLAAQDFNDTYHDVETMV